MSSELDSNFIFISFYDVIILATIMIAYLVLVFFILNQAYFENDANRYVILGAHEVIKLQKLKIKNSFSISAKFGKIFRWL